MGTRSRTRQDAARPRAGRRSRLRHALPLLVALAGALAVAPIALAHAALVSSDPADKAVLGAPPTTITLTFSEGLQAAKSSFKVSGPGGAVGTGTPAADGDTVMILGGLTLGAGAYAIEWTSAAADGDIERGTLSFTVTEASPAAATSSAPSQTPPQSSTPSAVPGVAASPVATSVPAADPAAASGTDVVLPIVAGLALAALIGFLVLRRNRAA